MNKRNKLNVNNSFLKGKTILITGGTGTFGESFAEKILKINNVKKIIIFSRDEYKQHLLAEKLKILDKRNVLRFFIGDIRDYNRLILATRGIDIVIHAAATKYVDTSEKFANECIDVNVVGSSNVARVSIDQEIETVIGISTDKTAPPVFNTYGLSKALMERLFTSLDDKSNTKFACVRFGNIAWSTGSVFPI